VLGAEKPLGQAERQLEERPRLVHLAGQPVGEGQMGEGDHVLRMMGTEDRRRQLQDRLGKRHGLGVLQGQPCHELAFEVAEREGALAGLRLGR